MNKNNSTSLNILLDCERMKFPQTGLYYFCLHLGKALQEQAVNEKIHFYTPATARGSFGDGARYITQHSLDKFFRPSVKGLDIWHCTFQGSSYYPFGKKIKKVFTIHDINFMRDDSIPAVKKAKHLVRLAAKIRASDHITAISRYTLDEVRKHIDTGNIPATVVYNGCNIGQPILGGAPLYIPSAPFLFTVGTIVDKKNMHVLPALLKDNDYELIIAGITISKAYKQKIIDEATRWNVSDRVIFTGAVSENDKQWYLEHCKAFVFPSLAEGFGLPVAEAMYFGKPLFLSALSSLPEIGGDIAYYFNSFDPVHMRQVLAEGLSHYNESKPAEAIKARAALFSWKEAARQYLDIYRSL